MPVLCQHCGNAPCEPVCPVFATVHSSDGLNSQIYNRCVGTRYCANNCPYNVRFFNWFEPEWPEPLNSQLNPDVTVRSRGVMEKCTFCVQRINRGRRDGARAGSAQLGERIQPACAQACPTSTLVFGDWNDPNSRINRLAEDPRRYFVLERIGSAPAVLYLRKVDPNAPDEVPQQRAGSAASPQAVGSVIRREAEGRWLVVES
jgi:molybdopterin-containing oxidoreductase family iron-sulfur binding subunit